MTAVVPQVFSQRSDLNSEVWGQNIAFERGRLYLVAPYSGKGNSTLCRYLVGYRHDHSGQIRFDDKDIKTLSVAQWVDHRKCHVSHLFQELRLFPELTAMENIQIKNALTRHKSEAQIKAWFEALGIGDKLDAKIGRMSFGQQQRVALIRALVQPFDFLLADEPISHLDDHNAASMADIMMTEARAQGAAVIVTSIGKHMDLPYEKTYHL